MLPLSPTVASATGCPRSVTCLTPSILNSSVKRDGGFFVSLNTSVKPRREEKGCLGIPGQFNEPLSNGFDAVFQQGANLFA